MKGARYWLVTITQVAITVCMMAGLDGCSTTPSAVRSAADIHRVPSSATIQREATIVIKGMACPFCTFNVERELLRVPGVKHVRVSLRQGIAYVVFSPAEVPTESQLRAAIKQAGFTAGIITMSNK